jgi:hypothetical protein
VERGVRCCGGRASGGCERGPGRLVGVAGARGQKKKKKREKKKKLTFFGVSILGAVGADAVGEVAGAAMGDRCGGCGCGMPGPKGKEKRKEETHFFFCYPYRVQLAHTQWATLLVVVVASRAWWWWPLSRPFGQGGVVAGIRRARDMMCDRYVTPEVGGRGNAHAC